MQDLESLSEVKGSDCGTLCNHKVVSTLGASPTKTPLFRISSLPKDDRHLMERSLKCSRMRSLLPSFKSDGASALTFIVFLSQRISVTEIRYRRAVCKFTVAGEFEYFNV